MTFDDSRSSFSGSEGEASETPNFDYHRQAAQPSLPLADREVPLPADKTPSLLNQWLDGEVPVSAMKGVSGGGESVDLWTKINDEAEVLRSRTTPLYVHKRIMDALPEDTYRKTQPWYRRAVEVTPVALLAAGAALIAAGAIVAQLALR